MLPWWRACSQCLLRPNPAPRWMPSPPTPTRAPRRMSSRWGPRRLSISARAKTSRWPTHHAPILSSTGSCWQCPARLVPRWRFLSSCLQSTSPPATVPAGPPCWKLGNSSKCGAPGWRTSSASRHTKNGLPRRSLPGASPHLVFLMTHRSGRPTAKRNGSARRRARSTRSRRPRRPSCASRPACPPGRTRPRRSAATGKQTTANWSRSAGCWKRAV